MLRIISGTWRRRRIKVPQGIRPTQDAMRETVFNVLSPLPAQGRCLDLFCGSGSLGLEALSRGMHSSDFVDCSNRVVRNLNSTVADMAIDDKAQAIRAEVLGWLGKPKPTKYDLVFADPPYELSGKRGWWEGFLALLAGHLTPGARVCLESSSHIEVPAGYIPLRQGRSGAAHWHILQGGLT